MKNSAIIVTFSGVEFDILNPDPNKILLEDIAHALSQTCRFTGHTKRFYSTAEHSVYCSYFSNDLEHRQACLAHDFAEAYLNDVASPIKQILHEYNKIEENLLLAIFAKYGIQTITPWDIRIKEVDKLMLNIEIGQLMPAATIFNLPYPADDYSLLPCWNPPIAKMRLLERATKLYLED